SSAFSTERGAKGMWSESRRSARRSSSSAKLAIIAASIGDLEGVGDVFGDEAEPDRAGKRGKRPAPSLALGKIAGRKLHVSDEEGRLARAVPIHVDLGVAPGQHEFTFANSLQKDVVLLLGRRLRGEAGELGAGAGPVEELLDSGLPLAGGAQRLVCGGEFFGREAGEEAVDVERGGRLGRVDGGEF